MKKLLVLLLVLVPALLLVFANAVYSSPPAELGAFPSFPLKTLAPIPSLLPLDFEVDIPDPALKAALHTKTGVPASEGIHMSDLAALNNNLFLDNLGIANAEGIQYCKNIQLLSLERNELTSMPDMSGMAGLEWLGLDYNNLTDVPSGVFGIPHLKQLSLQYNHINHIDSGIADMTNLRDLYLWENDLNSFPLAVLGLNLEILRLDHSPIGSIPSDISTMTNLKALYLSYTGIESLPSAVYSMSGLEILDASGNNIESIPSSVSGLTNLKELQFNNNKLGSLPDSICSIPHLETLGIAFNNLYSLPDDIGDGLIMLYAQGNRLTSIPDSVIHSSTLGEFNISMNRLTSLPSDFGDMRPLGGYISVEFNFLDVSPGSRDRGLIDANPSFEKYFERQLSPVEDLTATPSPDSVTLSWSPCAGGSGGEYTWTLKGYAVYLYEDGEMVKVSDVDKSQTSFTHTGLIPETAYSYRVGVDYRITDSLSSIDYTNRGYTAVDTTTLAGVTTETAPPLAPSAEISSETPPSSLPAAEETDIAFPGGENAFPVWAIVIAAIGALGILGTGAALVLLKLRKPKP